MIVIKYPPDFDGDLHIKVTPKQNAFTFEFTHTNTMKGTGAFGHSTDWETLVTACKGILAQANRMKTNA